MSNQTSVALSAGQAQKRLSENEMMDYLRSALNTLPELTAHQNNRIVEAFENVLQNFKPEEVRKTSRLKLMQPSYYWRE